MAQVISVVNQKGGVGKTTTAVNLGAYLSHLGKKVLLIDIDPQANATSGLGVDHKALEYGIYESIIGHKSIFDVITRTVQNNYSLAPATLSLAGAGVELVNLEEREYRLKRIIDSIRE